MITKRDLELLEDATGDPKAKALRIPAPDFQGCTITLHAFGIGIARAVHDETTVPKVVLLKTIAGDLHNFLVNQIFTGYEEEDEHFYT